MKSAYERALERFGPVNDLTEDQKAQIAEISSLYLSKRAGVELGFQQQIAESMDPAESDKFQKQMQIEIAKLNEREEREKDKVRNAG